MGGLRLLGEGCSFFVDGWNLFDTFLVVTAITDFAVLQHLSDRSSLDMFVALRFLRLVRLARMVRLLRFFKEMWLLVSGLIDAMRTTLAWAWLIIGLITYVVAILTTRLFGQRHGDVGTVFRSMYTLFCVMTTEGWVKIARETMEVEPWAWIVFVGFLCVTTFAVMNVVVAIIVQKTLERANSRQDELMTKKGEKEKRACQKVKHLFTVADTDNDGELTRKEFMESLQKKEVQQYLHEINIDVRSAESLFDILDYDESGSLDASEFMDGVMSARGEAKAKDVLAMTCDIWKAEKKGLAAVASLKDHGEECLGQLDDTVWLLGEDLRNLEKCMQQQESRSPNTPGGRKTWRKSVTHMH